MARTGISVCIPTHIGRGTFVCELLDTIVRASSRVNEPVEVIVVDDSLGAEATILKQKCDTVGAKYLRGPAAAGLKRNLAAKQAKYDVLFFTDSDCLLTPETLNLHVAVLRGEPEDVAGVVGKTEMHGDIGPVWRAIEGTQFHNACFDFAERYEQVGWGTTANLSVRTEVFVKLGGFAENCFTLVGGEDVDFGLKATKLGYRWVTCPEAVVLHRRCLIVNLGHVVVRLFNYGRADVFLAEQYPNRRCANMNPYSIALIISIGALFVSGYALIAASIGTAASVSLLILLEAQRRRKSVYTLYGDRPITSRGADRTRSLTYYLKGSAIDSVFDAGILWEAIRQLRPMRAFYRFVYVDGRTFLPRKEGLRRK